MLLVRALSITEVNFLPSAGVIGDGLMVAGGDSVREEEGRRAQR